MKCNTEKRHRFIHIQLWYNDNNETVCDLLDDDSCEKKYGIILTFMCDIHVKPGETNEIIA